MNQYIHNRKELGENLKLLRESKGVSQQKIADALYIDRSTYSYYEIGDALPNIFTLLKLAEIFNVNIENLLTVDIAFKSPEERAL